MITAVASDTATGTIDETAIFAESVVEVAVDAASTDRRATSAQVDGDRRADDRTADAQAADHVTIHIDDDDAVSSITDAAASTPPVWLNFTAATAP